MTDALDLVAQRMAPQEVASRWYCDREQCDGEPHAGWHWCEHAIPHPKGDDYWRCRHARTNQHPPKGEWRIWLLLSGRGYGKTRTVCEWLAHQAKSFSGTAWAAVSPTRDDLKQTMFEGDSGLLHALDMTRGDDRYNKTDMILRLPNGSMIRGLSAERPERTRGPNLAGVAMDEFAVFRFPSILDDLTPALRRNRGRIVIATTPRPIKQITEWVKRTDGSVVVTRGTMFDNAANLSAEAVTDLRVRWEGTRLGRQELYGELLEDVPGALWSRANIDATRCDVEGLPDFSDLETVA